MKHSAVPSPRKISRRHVTKLLVAALAATAVGAHTPYGQWTVYRQRNLFIVASRIDPQAMDLAHALVAGLALELPESHARATRATDAVRIASLLATGQLDVAIVARVDAAAILAGSGAYSSVGPVPLRTLAGLGGHLLVAIEGFKARHAFLLARAVDHLRMSLPLTAAATELTSLPLPMHPGAAAYWSGQPLPEDASP